MVKLIGILFALLLFVSLISSYMMRKNAERKNAELIADVNDMNAQYEKMLREGYTLKQIRHDMQKQLKIVSQLPENVSLEQLLSQVLADYDKRTQSLGIEFRHRNEQIVKSEIQAVDFLGVVLNLLDNAVEACAYVPEHPYIDFESSVIEAGWKLEIKNSKSCDLSSIQRGELVTTKENQREHGIGSQIVKDIMNRLGGTISFQDKGDTFVAKVVFPIMLGGGKEG